jgi:hypothetical protein
MAFFTKSLIIQRQIHKDACIAASACSLIDALGVQPPSQQTLDPLVASGMKNGCNGFASLAIALKFLNLGVSSVRVTPTPDELVAWFQQQATDHQGFLISHHVKVRGRTRAHITVIFHDRKGSWFQADPGSGTTNPIHLSQLVTNYAGDVAIIS